MGVRRIVIVGGGITGLATAHALVTGPRAAEVDVTVLERAASLGGSIRTMRRDGYTIDGGPDSWVANKPQATALATALGLGDALMPTIESTRRVYIAWKGGLHPLPEGLVLAVPTQVLPMLKTPLFSWRGKVRMGLEPLVPVRHFDGDDDESIGDFVTRRLGKEMTERLAAPLLGGIFAGDATKISIRATFPQFVAMEEKYGSLVVASRAAKRANAASSNGAASASGTKAPPSAFTSLRGGMGSLIDALAAAIGASRIRTSTSVTSVTELDAGDARGRYRVDIAGAASLFADDVVLAIPAHAAAAALSALDASLARDLAAIPYASTATVFLAFNRADIAHPLDGVGFLVPRPLHRPILAATWASSKWESRAPGGGVLMRAFFGGAWGEEILGKDDAELTAIALSELGALMQLTATPLFTQVFRFQRASPQPLVGHLARIAVIKRALSGHRGLYVAGSGFDGVGVPDCVRQANEIAATIVAST